MTFSVCRSLSEPGGYFSHSSYKQTVHRFDRSPVDQDHGTFDDLEECRMLLTCDILLPQPSDGSVGIKLTSVVPHR